MKNTVELLGYYGSDEVIACSAWTSTSRELTLEKRERIPNLLDMLPASATKATPTRPTSPPARPRSWASSRGKTGSPCATASPNRRGTAPSP